MLLKDLRKAIREGKLLDITGVKLHSWGTDSQLPAVLHISFDLPSVENKPVCDNLDIAEVSLSTKPKYDPCRRLRKGDIVTVRIRDGRIPWGTLESGSRIHLNSGRRYIVLRDENRNDVCLAPITDITEIAHTNITVNACYLELVTAVEELEPYIVKKYHEFYAVEKRNNLKDRPATYDRDFHPHAEEAAEAECARLNAEWRNELEQ